MSEARISRVFVASLHQAIADIIPSRLEFYENWLNVSGLRKGTIGLAPLTAVLSFLRREGDAYEMVTRRAGEYAAVWTIGSLGRMDRLMIKTFPVRFRARTALRHSAELIRESYPGSRAIVKLRRDAGFVDIRGSIFCEVREAPTTPLCGFYLAAISKTLELCRVNAAAQISSCRAVEGKACIVSVMLASEQPQNARVAA
jgi:hypothetical protein